MKHCPSCGSEQIDTFYSQKSVPVHSVRLLGSREEALNFPTGDMNLALCRDCGFIYNLSYRPELQDYSAEYESTQAYSSTFNAFAARLAKQLIDRYNLHEKDLIEIGCGQGEFLNALCEMGNNRGIGFDPAYDPSRSNVRSDGRLTIIADYYTEKYAGYKADFIVCKMTLEHIRDVSDFVQTVRRSVGDRKETTIFFQVPDVRRVLEEFAFWDIYYEHCSYFSLGSIARLFRACGFDVLDLWRDYGDQYLMIAARPADGPTEAILPQEDDLPLTFAQVENFQDRIPAELDGWKKTIEEAHRQGQKVILWGSGSKGVAFLTTLGVCEEIEYTIDINPHKRGTFLAGTGQKVESPEFLADYRPDLVILMNPLYRDEVTADLNQRGLFPRILAVGEEIS